jgi:uncharacterized protein YciI
MAETLSRTGTFEQPAARETVRSAKLPDSFARVAAMWYAIHATDNPGSLQARLTARPAHLARLHALRDAGRLLLAGPFPAIDAEDSGPAGFTGSLIVAEFTDLAAAQTWADADPYLAAGVYRAVDVRPFRKVLP